MDKLVRSLVHPEPEQGIYTITCSKHVVDNISEIDY